MSVHTLSTLRPVVAALAAVGLTFGSAFAGPPLVPYSPSMHPQAGSTATVRIILTIQTSVGSSTDDDVRTMATTGTANVVFKPIASFFPTTQFNALQLN